MNTDKITKRQAGKFIDEATDYIINELRPKIALAKSRIEKNQLYLQMENRQFLIDKLNKQFFK